MTDRDNLRNPYDDFAAAKDHEETPTDTPLLDCILIVAMVAMIIGMILGGGGI